MSPLLEKQVAIIAQELGELIISHDVPLPAIDPDMVLVKTAAVALNPGDTKKVDFSAIPGAISGYDFAGTIVSVGSAVNGRFNIGDRVCGFTHGMNALRTDVGAFAQFVGALADIMLKIPERMGFEEAATLGLGVATAGLALFRSLQVPGTPEKPVETPVFVLIYGGGTATGTIAIQLAKLAGLRPIATCSPKSSQLVKSRGAEAVFDYRSPNCSEDIKAYTKGGLKYALDCITESDTMALCYAALGRTGGRYCGLEPFNERVHTRRVVKPDWVMALTIFGGKVALDGEYGREADPTAREFGKWLFEVAQKALDAGKLVNHPIRVGNGFEGVLEGAEAMRKRTVSGEKLVYRVG